MEIVRAAEAPVSSVPVAAVRDGRPVPEPDEDMVVVEEPLEIRLNGETLALTMRTPGEDEALAAGFLLTEGIVQSREDIWDIRRCADQRNPEALNVLEVVVPPDRIPERILAGRQRYASSACGVCGRASIEAIRQLAAPFEGRLAPSPEVILSLPDKLRQPIFSRTGGLHAAGIFTDTGDVLFHAEDVGRHNAVDKAVGKWILSGRSGSLQQSAHILLVSGRAGFEIVQKALVARIQAVCSISAPSSLAVALAVESGMFLAGFVRGRSLNVYAGECSASGSTKEFTT